MTYSRVLDLAARWWPAPIAAIGLFAVVFSSQSGTTLLGALAVLCGFGVSRFRPIVALGLASGGLVVTCASDPWDPNIGTSLVFAVATGLVSVYGLEPMRWRLWSGAGIGAVAIVASAFHSVTLSQWGYGNSNWPTLAIGFILIALVTWALPFGIRAFMAALAAERAKRTVQARATVVESELRDERLRADITHDFHDVMAHSLAVLAAQAEGLRLTHLQHPERIDPVLTTISDTARLALVEVRQLLERVDDDARNPQPTVADIPALVDQTRSAGPRVAFHDAGRHGSLPRLGEIAAYRVVQEALTNALRHGGSDADIVVTLSWTGPGLSLAVSSPIGDRAMLGPAGRGITGMHERAKQAGGWVDIDADGDTFVVTAYLPYAPESEAPQATLPLGEDQLPTVPVQHVPVQRVPNPVGGPTTITPAAWLRSQGVEPTADPAGSARQSPATAPTPPASWGDAATAVHLEQQQPERPAPSSPPHPAS